MDKFPFDRFRSIVQRSGGEFDQVWRQSHKHVTDYPNGFSSERGRHVLCENLLWSFSGTSCLLLYSHTENTLYHVQARLHNKTLSVLGKVGESRFGNFSRCYFQDPSFSSLHSKPQFFPSRWNIHIFRYFSESLKSAQGRGVWSLRRPTKSYSPWTSKLYFV